MNFLIATEKPFAPAAVGQIREILKMPAMKLFCWKNTPIKTIS